MPVSYPYSVPILNPGGELGAMTNWTQNAGTAMAVFTNTGTGGDSAIDPHTGTYAMHIGNGNPCRLSQVVDISANTDLVTDIDAGNVWQELSYWKAGFASDNDRGSMAIVFLDASNVELACVTDEMVQHDSTWVQRFLKKTPVPVGTRKFQFEMRGIRTTGTENSNYYDDIQCILTQEEPGHLLAYSKGTATTGWTNVLSTISSGGTGASAETWGVNVLRWSSAAAAEAYRASTVPVGWEARVDAGEVEVIYSYRHGSNGNLGSPDDAARAYIEFRDSGGTLIGTRIYSETAEISPDDWYAKADTLTVPANTRSIRFGWIGTRTSGTELSAYLAEAALFLAEATVIADLKPPTGRRTIMIM